MIAKQDEEVKARIATLERILERDGGVRAVDDRGYSILLTKTTSGKSPYRVTSFLPDGTPWGHREYSAIGGRGVDSAASEFVGTWKIVEPQEQAAPQQQEQQQSTERDIPPLYFTRTRVPMEVWIEDEGKTETVQVPARKALDDVRKERDAYQRLLDCLRAAA